MLFHARLSKKFFHYQAKYTQRVHDVIPVRDMFDRDVLPTTPLEKATGKKVIVRYFRVFGWPTIFNMDEISGKGTRTKTKYLKQGRGGIFVGLLDDSAGCLFYVYSIKKIYISLDATFDEILTSHLSMHTKEHWRSENTARFNINTDPLLEKTSGPIGSETSFPDNLGLLQPDASALIDDPEQQDDIAFISIEDG